VHAHVVLIVDVPLHDVAASERDLAVHRRREPENDAARDPRLYVTPIERRANLDRAPHLAGYRVEQAANGPIRTSTR